MADGSMNPLPYRWVWAAWGRLGRDRSAGSGARGGYGGCGRRTFPWVGWTARGRNGSQRTLMARPSERAEITRSCPHSCSIATLHDEVRAHMAIAPRLITLAFGSAPEVGIKPACAALRRARWARQKTRSWSWVLAACRYLHCNSPGPLARRSSRRHRPRRRLSGSLRWGQPRWLTTPRYRIGA